MIDFFFKGFLIGFSIALPVGPIGLLCIRHSLHSGLRSGFIVGLGAASADALYGAVAGFGVTAVAAFLTIYRFAFQLIGALFLCYLGAATFFRKSNDLTAESKKEGGLSLFSTTFFLTLTNPMTIVSFAGIYAALGIGEGSAIAPALAMTGGVFLGSTFWWLLLSGAAAFLKERFDVAKSAWLNRVSGSVLFGFGIAAMVI